MGIFYFFTGFEVIVLAEEFKNFLQPHVWYGKSANTFSIIYWLAKFPPPGEAFPTIVKALGKNLVGEPFSNKKH